MSHTHPGTARVAITLDHPGDQVIRSSIDMPFAHGRNPRTDDVAAETLAWLVERGLLTPGSPAVAALTAARFHELAGLVYRDEDRDALRITSDYITALFFFDDLVDTNQSHLGVDSDLARRAAALLRGCVRSGRPPSSHDAEAWPMVAADRQKLLAIAAAFADVGRRLAGRADPALLAPFYRELDVYFDSMAREAAHRRGRGYASVPEYASARTQFSAVHACIEIGLALRGVRPSPAARRSAPFRRAMNGANLSVSYVNDLFSYKKEHLLDERTNLVMVLERTRHLSRAAAFEEACRICDGVVRGYLIDQAAVAEIDPQARAAAELFESWIRGNYDWHAGRTQRYVRALSTHAVPPVDRRRHGFAA